MSMTTSTYKILKNRAQEKLDKDYDNARIAYSVEAQLYFKAQAAFRARQIDDEQYLAARRAFDTAQEAFNVAETEYINGCNALVA